MDRKIFFSKVRELPFRGMTQSQVLGLEAILDSWEVSKLSDLRWLAYMLATTYHETARSMQPIREFGRGRNKKYGTVYYGRGYVQLTWDYNYKKASQITGVDLIGNPDRALEPKLAAQIMLSGMTEGWFTGKKLGDYFNNKLEAWRNARRIINGLDRAMLIGGYGQEFNSALLAATAAT